LPERAHAPPRGSLRSSESDRAMKWDATRTYGEMAVRPDAAPRLVGNPASNDDKTWRPTHPLRGLETHGLER